ncbi:MAG TPA: hypothetical protein VJC07_01840 [Candidatus Nanoarchaeia archaeon]|nr:hypothetical protein [Candidatus Nanoarchaeia archaeon]
MKAAMILLVLAIIVLAGCDKAAEEQTTDGQQTIPEPAIKYDPAKESDLDDTEDVFEAIEGNLDLME